MKKVFGVEIWKLVYDILLGIGLGLLIGSFYTCNWIMVVVDLIIISNILLTRRLVELDIYICQLSEKVKLQQIKIEAILATEE